MFVIINSFSYIDILQGIV